MDYEKKYEEALERAKKWHNAPNADKIPTYANRIIEEIFPELKESEGERVRKELLAFCKNRAEKYSNDPKYKNIRAWIAWLEKQGEQSQGKTLLETWKDMRFEVYQQASGNRHEPNYSDDTTKMFSLNDIDELIEKISEQQLANKIEPKFKTEEYNGENFGIDSLWHAQRILERTPGKVEGYQTDDGILEHKCALSDVRKLCKQKPAWSEEDSTRLQRVIDFLWYNRKGDTDTIYQQEQDIDWLKSLRHQNRWKPSDEHIHWLKWAINRMPDTEIANEAEAVLEDLLEQLKKLRGE